VTAGYTGINMLGDLGLPESIKLQMDARDLVKERSLVEQEPQHPSPSQARSSQSLNETPQAFDNLNNIDVCVK
jgi:hypothetical protein